MRPVRLAQVAVQAERLRLRRRIRRIAMQVLLAIVALPFLLAALGFFEAAFWNFVARHFEPGPAALIVAGGNLLVAGLLVVPAVLGGSEDRVSLEALQVRQAALDSAQRSLSFASMLGPVAGFLWGEFRRTRERSRVRR